MFPLWSIKGKGIKKGQGACWAPSFMPSALARRGSLTVPESLLLSYRAGKPSPGKAGRGPSGKTMDPFREEPTTKPAGHTALSLTHSVQPCLELQFHPCIAQFPYCQLLQSTLQVTLPTRRPQRGKGRLQASLGSKPSIPAARDFNTVFLRRQMDRRDPTTQSRALKNSVMRE